MTDVQMHNGNVWVAFYGGLPDRCG